MNFIIEVVVTDRFHCNTESVSMTWLPHALSVPSEAAGNDSLDGPRPWIPLTSAGLFSKWRGYFLVLSTPIHTENGIELNEFIFITGFFSSILYVSSTSGLVLMLNMDFVGM